jgi:tetratricopeptide (TPR) repeat protein
MNPWIYPILVVLSIAALPFFLLCWNFSKLNLRATRLVTPAIAAPPEYVKDTLHSTIAEFEAFEFKFLDYYQIERQNVKEEISDWGVLLYHEAQKVFAAVAISQHSGKLAPPINIELSNYFADGGCLGSTNLKATGFFSRPRPEVKFIQYMGFITSGELWQAHQAKLQEFCLSRQPLDLSAEEYVQALVRNSEIEVKRLIGTREIIWVEPDKTYRLSLLVSVFWAAIVTPIAWAGFFSGLLAQPSGNAHSETNNLELEIAKFQEELEKPQSGISPKLQRWLLLGTLAFFIAIYATRFSSQGLFVFVGVLLLHEGGHVLAMKLCGYRDVTMLFIPFLGALATAKKEDASLTEKVLISLAGPLPGLILGIGIAIALNNPGNPSTWSASNQPWLILAWTLIGLNLFNLLPIYPLDGGQVADLLLFSRNPYLGVLFKSIGVGILILIGWHQPLLLVFALLIALSLPHSFQVAKLQQQLRKRFRQNPPSDRPDLIRRIFESLQQPPYSKFAFAQKTTIAKGILDIQKERSASWRIRSILSAIYIVSLIGGAIGGLYALIPSPKAWTAILQSLKYIGKNSRVAIRERMQEKIQESNLRLQANPQDTEAYLERGRSYIFLKNFPQALADANQAIKLDPQSVNGYSLRGQVRRLQNDIGGSEADYKIVKTLSNQKLISEATSRLKTNPKDVKLYLMRAIAYGQLGNSTKALADFDVALKLEPQNSQIFVARGQFHLAVKNYAQVIADVNQSLRFDSKSSQAYFLRSQAYRQLGDINKANDDAKKAEEFSGSGEMGDPESNNL